MTATSALDSVLNDQLVINYLKFTVFSISGCRTEARIPGHSGNK